MIQFMYINCWPKEMYEALQRILISHGESFYSTEHEPIDRSAWIGIISTDPSLDPIEQIEGVNPRTKEVIQIPCPNSAAWNAHPDQIPVNIFFTDSGLEFQWGDEAIEQKARAIALKLNAKLHVETPD